MDVTYSAKIEELGIGKGMQSSGKGDIIVRSHNCVLLFAQYKTEKKHLFYLLLFIFLSPFLRNNAIKSFETFAEIFRGRKAQMKGYIRYIHLLLIFK